MKDDALFYTCSLIEYIGRKKKRTRKDIVNELGIENIGAIYKDAQVLHCEPIEKVADEFIEGNNIRTGKYDNVSACKYIVPSYWDIGEVFSRLITDTKKGDVIQNIFNVYNSNFSEAILDFNSALFFQSREYIKENYEEFIKDEN